MTVLVERTLAAAQPDGTAFDMHIRIGPPRLADRDWCCELSVTCLFDTPRDIFGVDSWQALQLALRLTAQLLTDFVDRGGRLLHFDEPLQPAELFVMLPT